MTEKTFELNQHCGGDADDDDGDGADDEFGGCGADAGGAEDCDDYDHVQGMSDRRLQRACH